MTLNCKINNYIHHLNEHHLLRSRQISSFSQDVVHFDSNDYLSLSEESCIKKAYQKGYSLYPSGSGASLLLSGYHRLHHDLEHAFAQFLQVDDCLLFSSGYAANLAVTALIAKINAQCILDKSIHASIYDGLSLSGAPVIRYLHNNLDDLQKKLKTLNTHSLVVTEGIFSMSGQMPSLKSISELCNQHESLLIVDEAHSFGVLGDKGQGAVSFHHLSQSEVPLRIISFGKAMVSQGAIVAGKKNWIEALVQAGRSMTYSTAISPALCYGLLETLEVITKAQDRRLKLAQLILYFKELAQHSPLTFAKSDTAIQQVQLGNAKLALDYARILKERGICCSAVRTPTVTLKETGLRIILNYRHNYEDIQLLFNSLNELYEH